jgi:hypothetical protein
VKRSADTRLIALKSADRLVDRVDGVPDLIATRGLCFGLAALFLVVAMGLPAAFVLSPPQSDLPPMVPILLLACSALAMILVLIFARTGLRARAWFSVGPSGFHYGDGDVDLEKDPHGGTSIAWREIASNPAAVCDVRLVVTTPHRGLPVTKIGFWTSSGDGGLVERSISMALIANRLSCVRFLNADAVRVALLRGMAARPGLRFDPDVFLKAGVEPETWRPIRKPLGGAVGPAIIRFQIEEPAA